MILSKLEIAASDITPYVLFDPTTHEFELAGKSIPADAHDFYQKLLDWLNDYLNAQKESFKLTFDINLEYFNTASHKYIAEIFDLISNNCSDFSINWHYHIEDDEMKQIGEIFEKIYALDFNFISYDD